MENRLAAECFREEAAASAGVRVRGCRPAADGCGWRHSLRSLLCLGLGVSDEPAIVWQVGGTEVAEDFAFSPDELPEDRSLILVDDDRAFVLRLARALETPWVHVG